MMASLIYFVKNLLLAFCFISCVVAELRRELTTRSWDALGFPEDVKRSPLEEGIIIGVIDAGIWPEAPSFSDKGLGPPPAKWKGICQPSNFNFTCNNKIIGARFYLPEGKEADRFLYDTDEISPRDTDGHGTHVAATVAGVPVPGVSVNGLGLGTARGALPRARIAVYKTCWGAGCLYVERAIDDAVKDGVDIITISIGRAFATPYHQDLSAIATLHALKQGVFVSYAAGNGGPGRYMMDNIAPWMLTVGNSRAGPELATPIKLGNGKMIKGQRLQEFGHVNLYPLVPSWVVSTRKNDTEVAKDCDPKFLDPELMKGKIVLCTNATHLKKLNVSTAAGFIFQGEYIIEALKEHYMSYKTNVTFVAVTREDFNYLVEYYNESTSSGNGTATASILKTTEYSRSSPPTAAHSSSRGPNLIDPTIMKPDLCAPGVNIIAAVVGNSSSGPYDSYSGTSMATPHASGIVGYVKTFHPDWSPAAIKSALLTTATVMANDQNNKEYELGYGSGQLNPLAAVDPGLVYNITSDDYLKYVCQWGQKEGVPVESITKDPNFNCSSIINMEQNWSLNLPTFSIPAKPNTTFIQVFERKVTNVGAPMSNYKALVSAPQGVEIQLQPSVLTFEKLNQELSYTVTVKGQILGNTTVLSAGFVWTDGHHQVRSPIVIYPEVDRYGILKKLYEAQSKRKSSVGQGLHLV